MQLYQNKNIVFEPLCWKNGHVMQFEIAVDNKMIGMVIVIVEDFDFDEIASFDIRCTWIFFNDYKEEDVKSFIKLRKKEVTEHLVKTWVDKGFELLVEYTGIIINGKDIFSDLGYSFFGKVISERVKRKNF